MAKGVSRLGRCLGVKSRGARPWALSAFCAVARHDLKRFVQKQGVPHFLKLMDSGCTSDMQRQAGSVLQKLEDAGHDLYAKVPSAKKRKFKDFVEGAIAEVKRARSEDEYISDVECDRMCTAPDDFCGTDPDSDDD